GCGSESAGRVIGAGPQYVSSPSTGHSFRGHAGAPRELPFPNGTDWATHAPRQPSPPTPERTVITASRCSPSESGGCPRVCMLYLGASDPLPRSIRGNHALRYTLTEFRPVFCARPRGSASNSAKPYW